MDGGELYLEVGQLRAIILALLATIFIILVLTSANRFAQSRIKPLSQAAGIISGLQADAFIPIPIATPVSMIGALPEIEALADLLSKKHRISAEVTRGVIGTAYGEGKRIGLDPLLIVAVISIESRFNPIAQSDAGAMGLMQIIPQYHKAQIASRSVLDPLTNIRVGAGVLKDYIKSTGTEIAGLQRYNGASEDTTNAYATKVLSEKQRL